MTAIQKCLFAVSVAAVLAAGAGVAFLYWPGADEPKGPWEKPFHDVREQAGITFRTRFLSTEQGKAFKVNLYDHGSGVAVADFDGDGHDGIYFVNQLGKNALYRNRGDGTFVDVTDKAGVGLGDRICTAATFGDYENKGKQSLFVTSTRGGNVLFHNNGDGTFTDVTKQAGLTHVGHSQAAFFFDYDGDGYLDLLVLQTATWTGDTLDPKLQYHPGGSNLVATAGSPREYNLLYRNNRDGTFTDVTEKSGLKGKGWSADAAIFDYDGDGKLDVLIACMFGPSQLYRNNGDGSFSDVTSKTLGRTPAGGMGARAFDFDNDGKLDLFIVDMHSDMWLPTTADLTQVIERKRWKTMTITDFNDDPKQKEDERRFVDLIGLNYDQVIFGNTFHHNRGNGKFEEIGEKANAETFWPWGVVTGDFDNDGYEDAFLPSGMGSPWQYWPNRLLMNMGNGTFKEQSREHGIEPPPGGEEIDEPAWDGRMIRSSRTAAVGDFDGDGRLEIVVNNFNDHPYLFKNNFPRKNYVAFRLRGTKSNRDAIGAVVRVYAGNQILTRQVHAAGGYLSQSSRTVHVGLGDRTRVDRVEITWPSGIRQELKSPALNQRHDVEEQETAGK